MNILRIFTKLGLDQPSKSYLIYPFNNSDFELAKSQIDYV